MQTWLAPRQLERGDRYVHRCHVRSSARESRPQISFLIEEALRLVNLPGEDQGRVYYFRKISVANLSPRTSRQTWVDGFRVVLLETANRAIHGADHRADSCDAVFFSNQQEALELLLGRLLRHGSIDQWFWPLVTGASGQASRSERLLSVIERLRELPASWLAVADSVMDAIGRDGATALLMLLPVAIVNSWLRELGEQSVASPGSRLIHLQPAAADSLRRAMHTLGRHDPRLFWLTCLAVIKAVPSGLSSGTLIASAQATLHRLSAEHAAFIPNHQGRTSVRKYSAELDVEDEAFPSPAVQPKAPALGEHSTASRLDFENQPTESTAPAATIMSTASATTTSETVQPGSSNVGNTPGVSDNADPATGFGRNLTPSKVNVPPIATALENSRLVMDQTFSLGQPTRAAGLYFLLNALRLLGIAEALRLNPEAVQQGLVARIMKRLATQAGADESDPILGWINLSLAQVEHMDTPPDSASIAADLTLFPSNLRPSSRALFDAEYFSRVWSIAVRRWCWQADRLTVREVVTRNGFVSLNRTDLDVTLSLDTADVRIRRLGLDIDPGWLPWFGKVVRFHYVWDENAHVH